jgi:hypothetical protein
VQVFQARNFYQGLSLRLLSTGVAVPIYATGHTLSDLLWNTCWLKFSGKIFISEILWLSNLLDLPLILIVPLTRTQCSKYVFINIRIEKQIWFAKIFLVSHETYLPPRWFCDTRVFIYISLNHKIVTFFIRSHFILHLTLLLTPDLARRSC